MESRNRFQVTNSASQCTLANFLRTPGYIGVVIDSLESIPGLLKHLQILAPSSLRFDLFKFMNKQSSIRIDLSFLLSSEQNMKKILSQNFSLFLPVSLTPLINIIREYLREFSKKFEMILLGYSGAQGTLIYEKNLQSKISCQTPFKFLNKESSLYS